MPRTMIIGVGWYSADQWSMLKLVADDPEALDPTYEQWCAGAEKTFQQLKSQPERPPSKSFGRCPSIAAVVPRSWEAVGW